MNKSKIGKRLLIYGAIVLIYAMFFKDVTADGRMVNLNLLSERQNLVIVGALMVLVGAILSAASSPADKVDASASDLVSMPKPSPVLNLKDQTEARLQTWTQALNDWRSGFFLRAAFALICSVVFMNASPLPWPFIVVPLLVFSLLTMRKLPAELAVGKACFWTVILTLPMNIGILVTTISENMALWHPILDFAPTLILLGCYFKYRRNSTNPTTSDMP